MEKPQQQFIFSSVLLKWHQFSYDGRCLYMYL